MAKVLPLMLSVLMVCTSVSISACDLSCWINQTLSDCQSANPAAENGMTATSSMEMSAEMEMGSHATQTRTPVYGRANGVMRHTMSAHMEMAGGAPQVISNSEVGARAALDHSRALSPCSRETCSQTAASSSPPKTSHGDAPVLHGGVIRVAIPTNRLRSSRSIAPGTPLVINDSVDLLSPLRI